MFKKKAQAAMEFLMTYGWAILVVLVVIGALAYFGVLSPTKLLPDKCLFGPGIGTCSDFSAVAGLAGSAQVTVKLTNGLGETISTTSSVGSGPNCGAATAAAVIDWAPGETETF